MGLLKAVREYDASKEASFRTFAEICIRNRLYSVLRAAARDKHMALNQSVPLDTPFFDANSYTSGTSDLTQRDPEAYLIDREHTAALLSGVRKQLSEFEAKILGYYLDGLSCREIAETVGKPPKSVDTPCSAFGARWHGSFFPAISAEAERNIFFFSKRG